MASDLRLNSEQRRVRRLALERRTTPEAIKAREAEALARLQTNPWIGARLAPAIEPDHPLIVEALASAEERAA